ncbi:MAG: ABC transporter permease subunit [Kiritimatiellaceae bacterium]|nr:ABC transporter permease subunit [Kiritimatiellaceae bacterium]
MIGQAISHRSRLVCSILSVVLLVAGYALLADQQHRKNPNDRTIPTWNQLWEGVLYLTAKPEVSRSDEADLLAAALAGAEISAEVDSTREGFLEHRILWEASKATLGRLFGGLMLGLGLGVLAGVLMGCFLKLDAVASPIMYFASRIIPTAAMPIFFKMAGIDLEMYVAMITFGSMPIVTLSVSQYVQTYPCELRYKAYTLGASHAEVITTAIMPGILPKIFDLAILMIGPALVYLIAAEQIVAGEGFGYRIRVLTKATRFEAVYPLIVILTVYAGAITWGLKWLQHRLCPWYNQERR